MLQGFLFIEVQVKVNLIYWRYCANWNWNQRFDCITYCWLLVFIIAQSTLCYDDPLGCKSVFEAHLVFAQPSLKQDFFINNGRAIDVWCSVMIDYLLLIWLLNKRYSARSLVSHKLKLMFLRQICILGKLWESFLVVWDIHYFSIISLGTLIDARRASVSICETFKSIEVYKLFIVNELFCRFLLPTKRTSTAHWPFVLNIHAVI